MVKMTKLPTTRKRTIRLHKAILQRVRRIFRTGGEHVVNPLPATGTLVVSYPKTGRTWLRIMLGKYLCLRYELDESQLLNTRFLTYRADLSVTRFGHDGSDLNKQLHNQLSFRDVDDSKENYRDKRILLLTRSIEDTMVSAYFQVTKRLNLYDGSISDFLRDERFGVEKFVRFYQGWHRQQGVPKKFAQISYEQMHADPAGALRAALVFIGEQQVDETIVQDSVRFGAFGNMQRLERSGHFAEGIMQATDRTDLDSHKVRRGVVGGYIEYLSSDDLEYIRKTTAAVNCPWVTLLSNALTAENYRQ